ncbi:hypothetical protein HDU80_008198, partial [Chytriomyces hyalinus]
MSVKGKGKAVVDHCQAIVETGTEAQITRFLLREDQPLLTKYESEAHKKSKATKSAPATATK